MTDIVGLLSGFRGGVHPEYNKLSAGKEIEKAELPERAILPLRQHIGAPCEALVEVGDKVKVGQKIAETESLSAPIVASVSGEVKEIAPKMTSEGSEMESIVIDSDGKDEWIEKEPLDWKDCSIEEIIERVQEAGITGLGGAGFPTHVKLNPPEGKEIDTLIINGAECEPYITADHQLMLEEGEKIIEGSKIIEKTVNADRIIVGIEDNKPDAIENFENLGNGDIEVVSLDSRYPQGDEYHMVKAILDREIPPGGLPFDVGVLVQNVGTAKAIYDAVVDGIPLVERVVTVTGDVHEPKNLLARFGTTYMDLMDECGGPTVDVERLICGGPMMGTAQLQDVPLVKGTNCVLVFGEGRVSKEGERDCIRCSRCVDACPMGLMPFKFWEFVRNEEFEKCKDFDITSCDNCGCCAYVCPAKIPLVEYIAEGKEGVSKLED